LTTLGSTQWLTFSNSTMAVTARYTGKSTDRRTCYSPVTTLCRVQCGGVAEVCSLPSAFLVHSLTDIVTTWTSRNKIVDHYCWVRRKSYWKDDNTTPTNTYRKARTFIQ